MSTFLLLFKPLAFILSCKIRGAHVYTFILMMMTMATNINQKKNQNKQKNNDKFLCNADVPLETSIFRQQATEINVYTTNRWMMAINLILQKATTKTTTNTPTKGLVSIFWSNELHFDFSCWFVVSSIVVVNRRLQLRYFGSIRWESLFYMLWLFIQNWFSA